MSKYAIDFDGVLWDGSEINQSVAEKIKRLRSEGHEVYLWTARQGTAKKDALDIVNDAGIEFDEADSAYLKMGADVYVDDRAISLEEFTKEERSMKRNVKQTRSISSEFQTRMENDEMTIEGYFAVFDTNYDIARGATESVAPGAFSNTLTRDIRALVDHETRLVLGRNKAGTLELREDSRGLWGKIRINPNDSDAINLYERVKRGDVDQCSFGFDIVSEDTEFRDDGSVHWTIREVKLYEVSVVTFPAYTDTGVSARADEAEKLKKELDTRKLNARKQSIIERLRGET